MLMNQNFIKKGFSYYINVILIKIILHSEGINECWHEVIMKVIIKLIMKVIMKMIMIIMINNLVYSCG